MFMKIRNSYFRSCVFLNVLPQCFSCVFPLDKTCVYTTFSQLASVLKLLWISKKQLKQTRWPLALKYSPKPSGFFPFGPRCKNVNKLCIYPLKMLHTKYNQWANGLQALTNGQKPLNDTVVRQTNNVKLITFQQDPF